MSCELACLNKSLFDQGDPSPSDIQSYEGHSTGISSRYLFKDVLEASDEADRRPFKARVFEKSLHIYFG